MSHRRWIMDSVVEAVSHCGGDTRVMSVSEAERLFQRAELTFAEPGAGPLWMRLRGPLSRQDPTGWKGLGLLPDGAHFLAGDDDGPFAVHASSPRDVLAILSQSYDFEFYVIDEAFHYIISQNDHDMLIVAGPSADSVVKLLPP